MNRVLVSALMIVALVSALVSPACAFVSGKTSLIEICTADGDYKTIAVNADQPSTPQSSTHKAQPDCAFCFATAHAKPMVSAGNDVTISLTSSSYTQITAGLIIPDGLALRPYQSRAPPSFV